MMIGQVAPTKVAPLTQPPKMPVGAVLSDRRFTALTNVIVFTPYAFYLARGKRPPTWLIVASLAYLGISFLEDLRYLVQGERTAASEIESALGAFPPSATSCAGTCGSAPLTAPPSAPRSFTRAMQYRVNR
jgi:hypothetical protein